MLPLLAVALADAEAKASALGSSVESSCLAYHKVTNMRACGAQGRLDPVSPWCAANPLSMLIVWMYHVSPTAGWQPIGALVRVRKSAGLRSSSAAGR